MLHFKKRGSLFLISGPSGAGKDEALKKLIELGCVQIQTATTRAPRDNEKNSKTIKFISKNDKKDDLEAQGFCVSFSSYGHHYYINTQQIIECLKNGQDCALITSKPKTIKALKEIEIIRNNLIHNFIYRDSPSFEFYDDLNNNRHTQQDSKENQMKISNRLEEAKYLISRLTDDENYDYTIINTKDIDFLHKQVKNIALKSQTIKKRDNKRPCIFFIIGSEESGKKELFNMIDHRIVNHNVKLITHYTDYIGKCDSIYKYNPDEVDKCDFIYTENGWQYGVKKEDIIKILKEGHDIIININNTPKIQKMQNMFAKYNSKTGFIFSKHDTMHEHALLENYADNIHNIDFTMLNVSSFNELDSLETMFYHKIMRPSKN